MGEIEGGESLAAPTVRHLWDYLASIDKKVNFVTNGLFVSLRTAPRTASHSDYMPLRYLFGPVGSHYADENLFEARRNGKCLVFHSSDAPDIVIRDEETRQQVLARLPTEWCPDFIALMLSYNAIPTSLWEGPIPLVGLAGDWHLLWHYYRYELPRCDMVVTDA